MNKFNLGVRFRQWLILQSINLVAQFSLHTNSSD
jgi:hypothetical protein